MSWKCSQERVRGGEEALRWRKSQILKCQTPPGASPGLHFHPLLSPVQVQTRNIRCLPDVLVINCEVNSSKEADFWKTQAEVRDTLWFEVFTPLSLPLASLPST